MNELLAQLFGSQPSYAGQLLGEDEARRLQQQAQQSGLLNVGLALLAGAGPSPQRRGVGELLAQGVMAGQQAYQGAYNKALQEQALKEQIQERQQMRQEQMAAQQLLPQILRPGPEIGRTFYGQPTSSGIRDEYGNLFPGAEVKLGAPQLDLNTLQQLLTRAPSVAGKVLPTVEAFRKMTAPERVTLSEGQQVYQMGPEGFEPIAGVPKMEKPDANVLEAMQVLGIRTPVGQLSQPERTAIKQYIDRKEELKSPKVALNMADPTAVAKQQLATMNQWQGYLKDSGDATVAVRSAAFNDAFRLANEQKNSSADSALIYNLAKIYDSSGAVQQGDINTIVGVPSIPMAVQKFAQKIIQGGIFTPQERQNMKNIVEGTVREREKALKPVLDEYRQMNKSLGGRETAIQNPYEVFKRKSLDEILGGQ